MSVSSRPTLGAIFVITSANFSICFEEELDEDLVSSLPDLLLRSLLRDRCLDFLELFLSSLLLERFSRSRDLFLVLFSRLRDRLSFLPDEDLCFFLAGSLAALLSGDRDVSDEEAVFNYFQKYNK